MTYRARRLAKAARLREWAEKREAKAERVLERARELAHAIPFGQPILVGHHSEKHARRDADRIHNGYATGLAHQKKAAEMRGRAFGIEDAADRAIYSDDSDAPERLRERIAGLEARHARMKAINAGLRRHGTAALRELALTDEEKRDLENAARFNGVLGYPSYALANNSANLRRQRERLATMEERGE